MGFWSKLVILALAALSFFYVKVNFFDNQEPKVEQKLVVEEQVVEPAKKEVPKEEKKVPKVYATVYFLGMDKSQNGIFKKVKREVPEGKSKLKFALEQLAAGPSPYEKKVGVYSEIPKTVKILGVVEGKSKVIIDISSNIQNGGGADSLYSRLKQVIKTALVNSPDKPVYLYLDGKLAEVVGGEGIMITQPLKENSLDE